MNFVLRTLASQTQYHDEAIAAAGEHVCCGVGVGPSQARLGSARLVTIEEKSSEKARLEPGSVTFGSWLGSARSQLARWLVSHRRAKVYLDERNFVS